jgi:hypothetical protein
MTMRSSRSTVTFSIRSPWRDTRASLPTGDYEVLVEEELLQGLSFEAHQTDGDLPDGARQGPSCGTLRVAGDFRQRLERGAEPGSAATEDRKNHSDAALSPQEDLK